MFSEMLGIIVEALADDKAIGMGEKGFEMSINGDFLVEIPVGFRAMIHERDAEGLSGTPGKANTSNMPCDSLDVD
jgi:hypothetical protein